MVKGEICKHLIPQKALFSIETTQIIFVIYIQTSNLIAYLEDEKRQKEGKRSGRKRTASTQVNDHQEKKSRI